METVFPGEVDWTKVPIPSNQSNYSVLSTLSPIVKYQTQNTKGDSPTENEWKYLFLSVSQNSRKNCCYIYAIGIEQTWELQLILGAPLDFLPVYFSKYIWKKRMFRIFMFIQVFEIY